MFPRAFHSTRAVLSSAPLRRTRDPLLSSPSAQHFLLPSGSSFVVRPPPSVVPPSHPLPPQPAEAHSPLTAVDSPFAAAFASSGASLLPSLAPAESALPPSRPSPPTPAHPLAPSAVAELQALRRSDPARWTRGRLAAKFGVSPQVVGTLGYGEGAEARSAERGRREQVERRREKVEGEWGWKKSIAREERRRRRSLW
ncbi:hypothetical protein JCM10207_004125 [Rhodosporidiobolus poonsookiae]